jgi:hypothetical protein
MSVDNNDSEKEDSLIKKLIKESLDDIKVTNEKAYEILISHIDEGFFESRQTPKPLRHLANQLVGTILGDDDFDEN